ncbi:hypothetical protein ANN_02221 [Periplaneta americana]|uniref:Uncharacterized protein n=1 Tax=Periplaneta americana TaxID=6978 RepID=A0ABQ8TVP4_PERAM|nr:hypothetical protein ANN_02221 [Periplaneta americana]
MIKRKLLTNKETRERKGVQMKQTDKVPTQRKRQKNKVRYLQIQKTKSWMSQYTSPLIMEIAKMMQNVYIATGSFLLTRGEKNGTYALNVEFGAMKSVLGMMTTKVSLCYCLES